MMKAIAQNGLVKRIKDFFILEPEEGEFEESEVQDEKPQTGGKVIPFSDKAYKSAVSLCEPKSADEARKASDDLRQGMMVVVNITQMEKDMAREFLDFLSGAAYAINGNYEKIGNGVFIFTPNGIQINKGQSVQREDEPLMFKDI